MARAFTYAYDNIGNRSSSATDSLSSSYTPNSLNQYASRTVPGSFYVTGLAPATATITVGANSTTRQGDYYYRNQSQANSSAPSWASYAIASSLGGSGTRGQFLPQTAENYTYDADGNLAMDGRWHYWWDAENRLIKMETIGNQSGDSTAVWNSGVARQKLEFLYDYLGRRVSKKVYSWGGSAFTLASETRFIYEDWNPIADYAMSGSTFTTAHRYVWGLDLSGSLHDGGGVGGLLAVVSASGTFHLPVFDGNGNVMGLVNRSDGTLSAQYEYSPFGEPLRASGTYAQSVSFRFSTKYADDETQLLWYGYRFYSPTLGRFFGRDPLEEKGGLHLYSFVKNNSVNAWDSLGLEANYGITECDWYVDNSYLDAEGCLVQEWRNRCARDSDPPRVQTDCSNLNGAQPPVTPPVSTGPSDDGDSGGSSGTTKSSTPPNNKPPQSRCDELTKKYGNALKAESGGFFDNQDDARRAMIINIALGARAGSGWEYASHVIDFNKLTSLLGTTNDSGQYFVTPAFSNWMVNLPASRPGNGGNVDVAVDPWFSIARGSQGVINRTDGRPGIGYPNSAVLDTGHSHPPGGAEFFSRRGDIGFYYDNAPITGYLVTPSGGVRNSSTPNQYDSSLIPRVDLQDIKGCFGDGRI